VRRKTLQNFNERNGKGLAPVGKANALRETANLNEVMVTVPQGSASKHAAHERVGQEAYDDSSPYYKDKETSQD
jgi:hypothetical protein